MVYIPHLRFILQARGGSRLRAGREGHRSRVGRGWSWGAEGPRGSPEGKTTLCSVAAPSRSALSDSYLSVTTSIKNTNSVKSHPAEMSVLLIMRSLTRSNSS